MTAQERSQMKRYWQEGDRLDAFALYLIASAPDDWMRYVSQLPKLKTEIDALDSIAGFQPILSELLKTR